MSTNNVGVQLQKAQEMKAKVEEFSQILTQRMGEVEDNLENYVRAGFPEDIAATYHGGYYVPDRSIIDDLSKDMRTMHVDFLDRVIRDLTEAGDQK